MIRKILITLVCLILSSCGGIRVGAGVKFKKSVNSYGSDGNPRFIDDVVRLKNGEIIGFDRPIGDCGAGIALFGILLPIIPIGVNLNTCQDSFDINSEGYNVFMVKLKYGGDIHIPSLPDKDLKFLYRKKFKFHIPNFWKFRMSDDKAIIVIGKTKDGKEFSEELPVKWGIMVYDEWSFP